MLCFSDVFSTQMPSKVTVNAHMSISKQKVLCNRGHCDLSQISCRCLPRTVSCLEKKKKKKQVQVPLWLLLLFMCITLFSVYIYQN